MVDTYTKVILTVIAVSLSTIAFKDFFVTPVNAGIGGMSWDDFYYDESFRIAVAEVIMQDCYQRAWGYADESGNVSIDVKLNCNY